MDQIKIEKTARFITYGDEVKAKNIWFVLHGYGQLPEFFIRKLKYLDPEENFIVAPEGFHRFYLNGTSGRVGASWMTKEAREHDIEDNIKFLNQLSAKFNKDYENRIILGFSQGGATAARWHELGDFDATHFILWASVFPPDLEVKFEKSKFSLSKNTFVIGKKDPYYDKEKIDTTSKELSEIGFRTILFDGEHDINKTALMELRNLLK